MPLQTIGTPAMWVGFLLFVLLMLAIDLGVFHRKTHEVSLKEAGAWSATWVALALLFNVGVYAWFGSAKAIEFTTGYLIEKALSVDNIFVFVLLFSYFAVPASYQHRVLFWGILGALVMRAAFILLGGVFLAKFHWAIYVFGGLLVVTGIKMLLERNETVDPSKNPIVRVFRRFFPVSERYDGAKFFTNIDGRRVATPLLLALVAIEGTDLIFAVDSIPAIFAITTDPFIVFTSNIFAILGLRSLYFLLAGIISKFKYLKVGLSLVLVFVGGKMLVASFFKIPVGASLAVIATLIGGSILASLVLRPQSEDEKPATPTPLG
jgi:tellurite resistance protein TerC